MNKDKILIIGSIHFDVISKPSSNITSVDKIGTSQIEIGGTGYNIAINLLRLGARTTFLSTVPQTPLGNTLLHAIEQEKLTFVNIDHPEKTLGLFNAHLNVEGELVSAISQMPIESLEFNESILIKQILNNDYIVADCNCAPKTLNVLSQLTRQYKKPFWISAVSEIKSLRIYNLKNQISGIVLNESEMLFFIKEYIPSFTNFNNIEDNIITFQKYIQCDILLTRGAKGAIFKKNEDPHFFHSEAIKNKKCKNRLGSGDAFFSSFLLSFILGLSIPLCLEKAHKFANIISQKNTANYGISDGLEQAISHFQKIGSTDNLTGLNNRSGMKNIIDKRQLQESEIWILLLDIDFFKKINDEFGHAIGDNVLQKVAHIFQQTLRKSDISGRWGGEEFIGLIITKNKKTAYSIAQRVRLAIANTQILEQKNITVSIGLAQKKGDQTLETVFEHADQALYYSKKNGRNRVTLFEDISTN